MKSHLCIAVMLCAAAAAPALAGDMYQWHYDGTTWTVPYTATGNFTHGAANYLASGVNNIATLTDASGVTEYYAAVGGPGQYGNAGQVVSDPNVLDVDTDDIRNGTRQFVTTTSGITEYLWGGPWAVTSTPAVGAGYTAAVVANDQDWVYALNAGNITRIDRTSLTTWAAPIPIGSGPYIDLSVRSRESLGLSIVFALTDDGLDEFYGDQLVRSHRGLFSGATGISTWQDQDNLFVSTTTGLLHLRRDAGVMFTLGGVSYVDLSRGYLDVDTATFRADSNYDLWAVAIPEPASLSLFFVGAALALVRRK